MHPSYSHNDFIVCFSRTLLAVKVGDSVVVDHPQFGSIVKRVQKIKENKLWISGDNPLSTCSEKFGWVPIHQIIGKVILKVSSQ